MDRKPACPMLEELWPAAVGESVTDTVQQHLVYCDQCAERVARLMAEIDAARRICQCTGEFSPLSPFEPPLSERPERAPVPPLPRPHQIGRYLIIETIATGGQATVYRGVHPSLAMDVAIKWSHCRSAPNDGERTRLMAEAKTLAELDHPHLARVHDLDYCEDRPFLVMDYIRGEHLRAYRQRRTPTEVDCLRIMAAVARAVAAAHELGILHLDLKPENILVDRDGSAKLVDFGLSFLSPTNKPHHPDRTRFAGTPQYMAPEQLRGAVDEFSPATDVFGLGAVLYFLCTGVDPDPAGLHSSDERRLPARRLRGLRLTQRLQHISLRAMSPRAAARYSGADQFASVLEAEWRREHWLASWTRRLLSITTAGLGLTMILVAWTYGRPTSAGRPAVMDVAIDRNGHELSLTEAGPLRPGDAIRVLATIPQSENALLMAIQSGQAPVPCQPLDRQTFDSYTTIQFPAGRRTIPYQPSERGLGLLLVRRRERPILPAELVMLQQVAPFPTLHSSTAVHFSGVDVLPVAGRPGSPDAAVTAWLASLNRLLPSDVEFCGVVLPPADIGPGSTAPQPVDRQVPARRSGS